MLRFFSMKNIHFINIYNIQNRKLSCFEGKAFSVRNNLITSITKIKYFGLKDDIRYQSTRASTEASILRKNKRKHRRMAKYVELLQITKQSTKQTKTKVKNLKAKVLADFINEKNNIISGDISESNVDVKDSSSNTDSKSSINSNKSNNNYHNSFEYQMINLEMIDSKNFHGDLFNSEKPIIFYGKGQLPTHFQKPEQINKVLNSLENFKESLIDIEEVREPLDLIGQDELETKSPKLVEEFFEFEEDLDKLNIAEIPKLENKKAAKNKKQKAKTKYNKKSPEQERAAKEKGLLITLSSYLNVCVTTGMTNRGLNTLLMYRQKFDEKPFLNIDLYNILLHGYAEKGNINKIKEILNILKDDQIALNHQSFAAIFECLGRLESNADVIKQIRKYKTNAEKLGITLNDIFDKSKFCLDQKEIILDAVKQIEPNFQPKYTPPNILYKNSMLDSLNKGIKSFDNENEIKICDDIKDRSEYSKNRSEYSPEQLKEFAKKQIKIELKGSITINSIENSKFSSDTEYYRKKLDEHFTLWRSQICAAINRDLNILRNRIRYKPHGYMTYYTYLKSLSVGQYADILINEIRLLAEGSESYSPTVNQLYRQLGEKVRLRYIIQQKQKNGVLEKLSSVYDDYCDNFVYSNSKDNPRQIWQRIVHSKRVFGPDIDIEDINWSSNVAHGVGKFLYNILMRDIKIDITVMKQNSKNKTPQLLPAFYTLFRNHDKSVKEEVKPHPVVSKLLRASQQQTLTFDANLIPMLCPPKPWTTTVSGGYLITKSELIRLPHQAIQQWERINQTIPEDIFPAYDSLNQLSSVAWKVNTEVLDIILEVFRNDGNSKLGVPQRPETLPPPSIVINENTTKAEKQQFFQQKMIHKRKQAEMYSLWCDTLYRLSLANYYRDKVFWLPHNMDFRGRVYPIPPHLNHLGSDLARSMLVFDKAQPLGPDGFSWLKLHCINLTGLKKRESVRERLLYAEEVMDEIIDSADNPLTGRRWWVNSDEPWQTLACCMEIAKVSRSPNPEEYMSRFPIHQDGSCNGLQHYAALGRDKAGAHSVNLAASSTPQDVYSVVASLVEKFREQDEKNGVQVAKMLNGFVRRKVIKQTVMTTVYGVTRYGARLQIAKQLKDIEDFPKDWVWPASSYLTMKTFESLREMFTSTKEIQDWFTDCAKIISNICNKNVEWISPLGLPIVQPYSNKIPKSPKLNMKNSSNVKETILMDMFEKPNTLKQKNAFPPNFIHSLDSNHMMLTSLHCEREGITFVSVHDCFWTHAISVPDMNKICREQFVILHSQPILEELSRFMVKTYFSKECESYQLEEKRKLIKILRKVPEKGDFDLNNVLKSVYFFS